jgi:hypothetical protein
LGRGQGEGELNQIKIGKTPHLNPLPRGERRKISFLSLECLKLFYYNYLYDLNSMFQVEEGSYDLSGDGEEIQTDDV